MSDPAFLRFEGRIGLGNLRLRWLIGGAFSVLTSHDISGGLYCFRTGGMNREVLARSSQRDINDTGFTKFKQWAAVFEFGKPIKVCG